MKCSRQAGLFVMSRTTLGALFFWAIVYLAAFPALIAYWHRDNNGPALTPNADYQLQWIPDADYQALETTDKPEVTVDGGRKTYAAGETWKTFRPYYVATPDGKWHVMVLARGSMSPYATRAVFGAVVPAVVFCVMGLALCLFGRTADTREKKVEEPADALA